ncbi:MAG: DUF5658 family protein [Coriobacteriia bacterium]
MIEPSPDRRSRDRRKSRYFAVRWPERRSGFDRRDSPSYLATLRTNPAALFVILLLLNLMNFADLLLTQYALALGAHEGNPVMRLAFDAGDSVALLAKVGGMLLLSLAVWQFRRYMRILDLALAAMLLYAGVIAYHLIGLSLW